MASNIKQVDRISLNEILERQIRTRELTNQKEQEANRIAKTIIIKFNNLTRNIIFNSLLKFFKYLIKDY